MFVTDAIFTTNGGVLMDNPKPTHYLLMFEYNNRVCWSPLEHDEWQIIKHRPEEYLIFDCNGQMARIFVATADNNLTKGDALKTASNFVYGRYWSVDVNLNTHEEKRSRGNPI